MPEVETATSAGTRARRKGLPKELQRGGWKGRRGTTAFRRNRGQAGVEGDAAMSREDGDDDSRCTGEAAQAAGGGIMAATPLDDGGNAPPAVTARNGGQAMGEEAATRPGKATARPAGARSRRERRLEAPGAGEREGPRWGGG
uniref:Uncharacterized protein n=2 Tax=Oryza sativa subsp. japonica TaxID=39947 RepID=Q69IQ8_ORYSJ|nr:hypothetical protein [Oryza sativa Japonica Group]BAD32136.1 hypothetical protein [Oryza sativa Japonica Group]